MKDKYGLVWNVYVHDINSGEIKVHNVFYHSRFYDDVVDSFSKCKGDKDTFLKGLKMDLMYYYWSKFEWEVNIGPLFEHYKDEECKKIDVYQQVINNWDIFAEYTWQKLTAGKKRKPTEK